VRNYILYFIQVDKMITTKQSKIMHAINSITEFAGKITICVVNKGRTNTFILRILTNMLTYIKTTYYLQSSVESYLQHI
jgi:hypothetical protein